MDQALLREMLARHYAAGALDPALALLAETQAALVPAARAEMAAAEALAGALFERSPITPMAPSALDAVLAKIRSASAEEPKHAPPPDALAAELAVLPAPAREAALTAAAQGKRWAFAAPGLRALVLSERDGVKCELLRIWPGHGAPTHTHEGAEYTLVLQGAFHDGHARYDVGDISYATPELTHRPVAERGAICYALAVTEQGLRFTGALGAVQRLLFD